MQQGQAVYYPASSSASSANFLNALPGQAASGDARNCTCCSDRNGTCSNSWEASNGSTFSSQLTPPEHALTSCPSSSFSASTATSGTSPTVYPEFLYPPLPPQSVLPSTSSGGALNHFQHHLPKSLSRSSISSNGSTLLFSPSLEAHTLHNYSPLTPPLPLPLEGSSKGSTLPPQTLKLSRSAAPSFNSNPPSQIPILPNMQVTAGSSTQNSSFNPSFLAVTPACISQLATYLAEMMVYLWFSPPQKRAPTFPKPTSAFARFCNDILTTSKSTLALQ